MIGAELVMKWANPRLGEFLVNVDDRFLKT